MVEGEKGERKEQAEKKGQSKMKRRVPRPSPTPRPMLACVEQEVVEAAVAVVIVVLGPPYLPVSILASQSIGVSSCL